MSDSLVVGLKYPVNAFFSIYLKNKAIKKPGLQRSHRFPSTFILQLQSPDIDEQLGVFP
jgi:hypothetical protein